MSEAKKRQGGDSLLDADCWSKSVSMKTPGIIGDEKEMKVRERCKGTKKCRDV
jgi:hypothetical protein